MVDPSPFTPAAGATPPRLVGRADTLELFSEGLDGGLGAHGSITAVTGMCGVGKTALLSEYGVLAKGRGWAVVHETATDGLADRVNDALSPHDDADGSGLLITIDDVHEAAAEDLRALASRLQDVLSGRPNAGLVLAGLPSSVDGLLHDDALKFLRRADPVELGSVPLLEVREAFRATIEQHGRTIDDDALDVAVEATAGYPAMIQLVGYHAWAEAGDGQIGVDAVLAGIPAARAQFDSTVLARTVADLSDVDRGFLAMMACDDGPSEVSALASRLGEDAHYIGVYRRRLIEARVIEPVSSGQVGFTIPYLREYLREHGASSAP